MMTGVSAEPASTEDGVTAEMAGTGFEFGGGGSELDGPPPQEVMKMQLRERTTFKRTHLARFMAGVRVRNHTIFDALLRGNEKHDTCL